MSLCETKVLIKQKQEREASSKYKETIPLEVIQKLELPCKGGQTRNNFATQSCHEIDSLETLLNLHLLSLKQLFEIGLSMTAYMIYFG